MAKYDISAGSTSQIWELFFQDFSSSLGSGLPSLAFNTAGLTCYYKRNTAAASTLVNLASGTIGLFTASGFKLVDNTNMIGLCEFCPPNAALAVGATSVFFMFQGAANMSPLPLEVQLNNGIVLAPSGFDSIVVENGVNPRQWMAIMGGPMGGVASGAETNHHMWFQGVNNPTVNRIFVLNDASGNRSSITYNIPT